MGGMLLLQVASGVWSLELALVRLAFLLVAGGMIMVAGIVGYNWVRGDR